MIVELVKSYDRLAEADAQRLPPLGYSSQKIAFAVVLNSNGSLHAIEDRRQPDAKGKPRPVTMTVPGQTKASGSGFNPCLLWDNPAYMLGFKVDDPNPERTREAFQSFRDKHLTLEKDIAAPEFSAVCRFLENWQPIAGTVDGATALEHFGVFQIRGQQRYVHRIPQVEAYWSRAMLAQEGGPRALSLLSGQPVRIARLHEPKIKGVYGAQGSGALLVSFNAKAYESYGRAQGDNAPVGEEEAFKYCTALNLLVASREHRLRIADTTAVFWTEKPTQAESFFGMVFDRQPQDESLRARIYSALDAICLGRFPRQLGEPSTPFYVLGLTGNAGRLAVRFWYVNTLAQLCEQIGEHFNALSIQREWPATQPQYPSVWQLLRQGVRTGDDVPPLIAPTLLRSILFGTIYPSSFYAAVLRRINVEGNVNYFRAAIIKAVLLRNYGTTLTMSLDEQRTESAYLLGRLFAVLEHAQFCATRDRKLNRTIKERFFGAAAMTPAQVFPTLMRGVTHHLSKLSTGGRIYFEKLIQGIRDRMPPEYPARLNVRDQGLFDGGYYHQRIELFKSKQKPTEVAQAEADAEVLTDNESE
jgi:CRISPR-associated protein Csd1